MAHFAEIVDNVVQRVLVIPDSQESRGQAFLAEDLKLGGTWIQCSYNGTIRRNFPGKGCLYLSEPDIFIPPKPYPSWSLDDNYEWQAGSGIWDEENQQWVPEDDPENS